MKKYKNNKVTIVIEGRGKEFSIPHKKGGSGLHKDRRTKRRRTRSQQNRAIIDEQLYEE